MSLTYVDSMTVNPSKSECRIRLILLFNCCFNFPKWFYILVKINKIPKSNIVRGFYAVRCVLLKYKENFAWNKTGNVLVIEKGFVNYHNNFR